LRRVFSFVAGLTRTAAGLSLLVGCFLLADYLVRNTPKSAAARCARENAAAVLASGKIYEKARRDGDYAPDTVIELEEEDCTCDTCPEFAVADAMHVHP